MDIGSGGEAAAADEDPFGRSWLLTKLGIWKLDPDDLEWRIARLKRAHEDGVSIADFSDLWLQCMRGEVRSRIEDTGFERGLASIVAEDGDAADAARLAILRRTLAALDAVAGEEPDLRRQAMLSKFFRSTSLDTAWFGRTGEDAAINLRHVLREVGRLKRLAGTVTLMDLIQAMAHGSEVDPGAVEASSPPYDDDVERFAARLRRPTADEVSSDYGRFAVMVEEIAIEMAKPAELRDVAGLQNMREWRNHGLERLSGRMSDYFMADAEYPGYVPADDPGRLALHGFVAELEAFAENAIRSWNGASVDEIYMPLQMLKSIALLTDAEVDTSRFEGRLMIGSGVVDGYILDDEPELLFQDIDGNTVMVLDGEVEIGGFPWDAEDDVSDDDAEEGDGDGDEGHPLVLRDEKWAELTVGASAALSAFVRQYGGAAFWRGAEEKMCRMAVPEIAALADESELFGEHVRCAFRLFLDTWGGREKMSGRRPH